jgi:UDPglucose 6-dehydrogenase
LNVVVIGTGYVGITTGLCLGYIGHNVTCLDIDANKIERLRSGIPPIHEPGLENLMEAAAARLEYETDGQRCVAEADVVFIAVGTPPLPDGNPDLQYLRTASENIGRWLGNTFTVIVNKSTVPVGSGHWVESIVRDTYDATHAASADRHFAVASNPEFLREGSAIHDSLYPDRIVIGFDDPRVLPTLAELYRPIVEQSFSAPQFAPRPDGLSVAPLVTANLASAELIKYAANAFLATKISFVNEIGHLAERVGADITQVVRGIGLDSRIGSRFLQAGVGWGGSCFGKDTAALVATGREYGLCMRIVQATRDVNYSQRERVIEKLMSELKILKGKTIGILGLAFKPHTDDIRDSPALDIGKRLVERGAKVRAHDPVALAAARKDPAGQGIEFCESVEALAKNADAVVLATEWQDYFNLPWIDLGTKMRTRVIIDGRNFLDKKELEANGFRYIGMGI